MSLKKCPACGAVNNRAWGCRYWLLIAAVVGLILAGCGSPAAQAPSVTLVKEIVVK